MKGNYPAGYVSRRTEGLHQPGKSGKRTKSLASYLQQVREEERKHIAREIHDELGQELAILKLDIMRLQEKIPACHESVHAEIKSISEHTNKSIRIIQNIISKLRPVLIDKLNLQAAVEWQLEEFQKRAGISCNSSIAIEHIVMEKEREIYIFRIVQEILSNIIRHAYATKVQFRLKEQNGHLELTVKDNGIGVNAEKLSVQESFGIIGMKERVAFLEGSLIIEGVHNKGTSVSVRIPVCRRNSHGNNPQILNRKEFSKSSKRFNIH